MSKIILEMKNICKTFPKVRANHNVSIDLREGEVLALLGENGAGKSVLMSILEGYYKADSGEIFIDGEKKDITSPKIAIENGIGVVHQHFILIPVFTALENIILGLDMNKKAFLDKDEYREKVQDIVDKYGLSIDLDKKVGEMSVGEQQRVEIIKMLYRNARILVLDEPTAVLTPKESRDLFTIIQKFQADGKSVIFISHKMDELMEFSNRITILRRGEVITTFNTCETSIRELASTMVGYDVQFVQNEHEVSEGEVRLKVEGLTIQDERGIEVVKNASLEVKRGEILSIAGIDGNGQNELVEGIMGLLPVKSGRVFFDGKDITGAPMKTLQELGFGFVPPDRKTQGLVLDLSVRDNMVIEEIGTKRFQAGGFLKHKEIKKVAQSRIEEFDVRPPIMSTRAKSLSGGNQQKVIVARVFDRDPDVLIAVNPVRGIDINATEFIHNQLLEQKKAGATVIVVSTDLDEVFALSDRIAVICHGEITGVRNVNEVTPDEIGLMMTGVKEDRNAD